MWYSVLFEYFVMHITTYVLRNNAMFFAELKLKLLISVLFYRHTHDQKSKAEH